MRHRRLLVVVHYPTFGGPHNRALQLAPYLEKYGWNTTVLLPDEVGNAAGRLQQNHVEVTLLPLSRVRATINPFAHFRYLLRFWPEVVSIWRLIRKRKIDAVMIGGLANPHAAFAARLAGVPVVWQVVDTRTPGWLRDALMVFVRHLADAVMFNGQRVMDLHGGASRVPAFVYFPPVDTRNRFVPSSTRRRLVREGLGISQDAPVVGTVANINPQKGIEYFVRCAAIVWHTLPEARFIVVGSQYEDKRRYNDLITEEVKKSGLPADQLLFVGGRTDVENYYATMDVKLITSVPSSEGTTTTAIEAMSCGVPVVTTDVGAVSELVEDGVTGFVVPPLNSSALARSTLDILQNTQLKIELSRKAVHRAHELFDITICRDQHMQALEASVIHREKFPGKYRRLVTFLRNSLNMNV